jgi:hypothetical protein
MVEKGIGLAQFQFPARTRSTAGRVFETTQAGVVMIVSRLPHSIHKVEGDPHSRSCNLAPRMLRLLRCMGLLLALLGSPAMSALAPLLWDKRTSRSQI